MKYRNCSPRLLTLFYSHGPPLCTPAGAGRRKQLLSPGNAGFLYLIVNGCDLNESKLTVTGPNAGTGISSESVMFMCGFAPTPQNRDTGLSGTAERNSFNPEASEGSVSTFEITWLSRVSFPNRISKQEVSPAVFRDPVTPL